MKVTDVKTMVVENEPPYRGGRYLLFIQIETDEGITGLGERITGNTYSDRLGDLQSQISLIQELAGQFVVGENPFNIERIWDRMYSARHDFRHPSLQATPVLSGYRDRAVGHRGQRQQISRAIQSAGRHVSREAESIRLYAGGRIQGESRAGRGNRGAVVGRRQHGV